LSGNCHQAFKRQIFIHHRIGAWARTVGTFCSSFVFASPASRARSVSSLTAFLLLAPKKIQFSSYEPASRFPHLECPAEAKYPFLITDPTRSKPRLARMLLISSLLGSENGKRNIKKAKIEHENLHLQTEKNSFDDLVGLDFLVQQRASSGFLRSDASLILESDPKNAISARDEEIKNRRRRSSKKARR
jgi:hypothetical protein